jgi:MFS family permease
VTNPYRAVLRTPGAIPFVLAGFVGRMPMSMMTIAVLLVVRHRTDSYALAGAASAAHTLTQAVITPFVGRLSDRLGQSKVLPKLLLIFLTGISLIVGTAAARGPVWLLFAGAVVAGAGQLPYPSLLRTRWAHLLGSSPELSTAMALESAADEAIFVMGPLLVTALATVDTLLAPIVAGLLALLGTVPFVAARASEPPPNAGHGAAAWRIPALWILIIGGAFVGTVFGCIDVTMVAFAQTNGVAGLSGALLGLIALGSLISGLLYGARRWKSDLAKRYQVSTAAMALGCIPAIVVGSVWQMAPAALLIGVSVAPTLIASSGLITRVVPVSARTEGFTWQSTGINVGVAGGAALAGLLVQSFDTRTAFLVGPIAAGLAAVVAIAGNKLLAPRLTPRSERVTR